MDLNCEAFGERRDEFRKYLESTGVIEKLTMALSKLYQETDRPEDPIKFIRSHISGDLMEIEEIKEMKSQIETLKIESQKAEVEAKVSKISKNEKKLSVQEMQKELMEKFKNFQILADENAENSSLLRKYLTEKLINKIVKKKTKFDATLLDNIQSGLKVHDQEVGVFASDADAYTKFAILFDLILNELHDVKKSPRKSTENDDENGNQSDATGDDLIDIDPEMKFVKSISLKTARNLEEFPFISLANAEQMTKVVEKIRKILTDINDDDDEMKGKYHELTDISDDQKSQWIKEEILFVEQTDNKALQAAGTYRLWPHARGIFINDKNNIKIWVNEEEHFQVISYEIGGNLKSVYERLNRMMENFESLQFCQHKKWGFLSHNLKSIGHATKVSIKIKIVELLKDENKEKWEKLTENLCVNKKIGNEDDENVVELMNKKMVGVSEIEALKEYQKSVADIINAEKCLFVAA